MKRFALILLFPVGFYSGNRVLSEHVCDNLADAIKFFSSQVPEIPLNEFGYAKVGVNSYTVAQYL